MHNIPRDEIQVTIIAAASGWSQLPCCGLQVMGVAM